MARSTRDEFERERDRVADIDNDEVRAVLLRFADALDPEVSHEQVPKPTSNGGIDCGSKSNNTAKNYLSHLRTLHQLGLNLLDADAETVNRFMEDFVTDPKRRRYDLVDGDKKVSKPTGKGYQSALRGFYRYCDEPNARESRPGVSVSWPADGSDGIHMFRERSDPKHDEADMPEQDDLDAIREACLAGQNTRRDRAFLELAAGTGQRVYALVTLRIKHVNLGADVPHVLLNPEIDGDGDKGAIEKTGRWKPIVTDTGPVRKWIENHPLRDPDERAEHGAPESFEDCYLFIGSLQHWSTDPSEHLGTEAARNMLARRKADTTSMTGVKTVEVPVNPHNWRHYAYTKSQDLPIDESVRRKVFGWADGSDTGEHVYGHITNQKAGEQYAEAFAEAFGDADTEGVAEQVVGAAAAGDLPPEVKKRLVSELTRDDDLMSELAEAVSAAAE